MASQDPKLSSNNRKQEKYKDEEHEDNMSIGSTTEPGDEEMVGWSFYSGSRFDPKSQ